MISLFKEGFLLVYITGDMHGDLSRFKNPIFKKMKAGDVLIVCGDFGFIWDGSRQEKQNLKKAAGNAVYHCLCRRLPRKL